VQADFRRKGMSLASVDDEIRIVLVFGQNRIALSQVLLKKTCLLLYLA